MLGRSRDNAEIIFLTERIAPAGLQARNLPFAALIDGGDPGVDGSALSQLNPLGCAADNRLILLVRYLSKTD